MAYPSSPEQIETLSSAAAAGRTGSEGFSSYLERVVPEIDARIAQHLLSLPSSDPSDADLHRMLLSGKRLRGAILLLSFEVLSSDPARREVALDLATVVELAHGTSLVLDDIIDEDVTRRGEPALYVKNGERLALLKMVEGISLPYGVAAGRGGKFVELLADTHRRMVAGVLEEARPSGAPTAERYGRIVSLKTGALFSLSARYGAMAAGASKEMADAFAEYGMRTGRSMQIADDIADLQMALDGRSTHVLGSELVLLQIIDEGERRSILTNSRPAQSALSAEMATSEDPYYDLLRKRMMDRLEEELSAAACASAALKGKICSADPSRSTDTNLEILLTAPLQIAKIVLESAARQ